MAVDGEGFHQDAGANRLARLVRGTVVGEAGASQGEWQLVRIEGWIFARSVGAATRPNFDLAVTREPEENLRAAPNGTLLAQLVRGTQLHRVRTAGAWVLVRRDGWVRRAALTAVAAGAGTSATTAAGDTTVVDPAMARSARATGLHRTPAGAEAGRLAAELPVRVLSRGDEWSRVQIDGWVRTADLDAAPPGVLLGVSAAEVRADPRRFEGRVLRWTLQYIATQTADELRPDIPTGATYLLTKGPLPERGFVYVVVPDSLRGAAAGLAPLAQLELTARVRRGRSRYLGHPIVDLLALEAQR